ncbi:hypothetical protein [Pseudolysinimonas sp.]|uniref:hypothetical protein n=1 Tax=Pseudolysinimonas sp. TaxID=2680009 RepID=UPI002869EDC3|nr:hypothetical protein [Pseudolysinimonas sp.]
MSTTLSTHPPQQAGALQPHGEAEAPRLTSRRPSALDKLALRLGLLLITYGRRRYALSREELALNAENARARQARELDWDRAHHTLLPPR